MLECLGVAASEAIAIEDSPNGVTAARRAGLRCVAIPNSITARLDLSGADLVLGVRGNRREVYTIPRRIVSYCFNTLPRILFGVTVLDAAGARRVAPASRRLSPPARHRV